MKYILIIGDGMADNPLMALGGKTPLEVASIPTMDALASKGELGSVRNVPEGYPPGSDTAIMSIFGCAPQKYYTGRAPLEAAAQGIALSAGDAAMRCNNVTLSDGESFSERKILSHCGGGIEGAQGKALVEWLFAQPEFLELAETAAMEIFPTESYRHICVQRGVDINGLSLSAPHDHLEESVADNMPSGCEDAIMLGALMEKACELLEGHPTNIQRRAKGKLPANAVWFWAQGTAAGLQSFPETYGKTGAVISAVPLCHGIARLAGLDTVEVDGATGELDTNYEGKVEATLESLKEHDFVVVHVEAPDECSHLGDLRGKLQAIEWLDSRIIAPIVSAMSSKNESFRMLILADHKTLAEEKGLHDGDPVPYILYDSRKSNGSGLAYTEKNGEAGPFVEAGVQLMEMLFSR